MIKEQKQVELDLKGAHCSSCVYTIEHAGRKIKGISDIKVDSVRSKIILQLDDKQIKGDPVESVIQIVRTIGYEAERPSG